MFTNVPSKVGESACVVVGTRVLCWQHCSKHSLSIVGCFRCCSFCCGSFCCSFCCCCCSCFSVVVLSVVLSVAVLVLVFWLLFFFFSVVVVLLFSIGRIVGRRQMGFARRGLRRRHRVGRRHKARAGPRQYFAFWPLRRHMLSSEQTPAMGRQCPDPRPHRHQAQGHVWPDACAPVPTPPATAPARRARRCTATPAHSTGA